MLFYALSVYQHSFLLLFLNCSKFNFEVNALVVSGEPNSDGKEDCMEVDSNGLWYDVDCFTPQASVCEKKGNVDNIVGVDPSDDNCDSNAACCFKYVSLLFIMFDTLLAETKAGYESQFQSR